MKKESWYFIVILIITLISLVINLSQPYKISFSLPVPFTTRFIQVNKNIAGINPQLYLRPFNIVRNFNFSEGLDLQGGTSITLRANMNGIPPSQRDAALASAQTVIERRVNFYGVSEPVVETAKVGGDYRIIVQLPGVTNLNQAVSLVGQTAKLTFWEQGASQSAKIATPSASEPIAITQILGPNPKQTDLTGADLNQAAVTFDPNTGAPQVALTFNSDGAKKFANITQANVGKLLVIALDNQMVEWPRVNQAIYGGNAVITGTFTTSVANTLADELNAGALPVSMSVLQEQTIGASLGASSLEKSMIAGLIGFMIIVFFMISFYRRLGIVASIALVIYTLIVLTLFRVIPVTLTLAGIAAFILSVGIAVDANILIFERMKEEFRRGRSEQMAIELGFSRAWPSIRDSNVSGLITSSILYYFGTGVVKGFAFTLALGILVSMFSAIFVTRTFLQLFYKKG